MSDRRQSAATATVGGIGVGGSAALRHEALVRSHDERSARPVPRKRFAAERRMIHKRPGRKIWLTGAALGAVSLPAFATGVHGTLHPTGKASAAKRDREHQGFLREGLSGAKAAVIDRTDSVKEKAPTKLVAGNYAAGVGVGSAAGGLTHLALRKVPINLHAKASIAALAAGAAGTAALPLQSKLTARASHGKYQVTPTGVDARSMDPRAFRAQTVGKMSPRTAYRTAGAHVGAHWTVQGLRAADKIDVPNRTALPKSRKGRLVYTGRTKAANLVRGVATDVGSINDKDAMARNAINGHPLLGKSLSFAKREDPGASMSRGERRARIAASGPPIPLVGDVIQAGQEGQRQGRLLHQRDQAQGLRRGRPRAGHRSRPGHPGAAARAHPAERPQGRGARGRLPGRARGSRQPQGGRDRRPGRWRGGRPGRPAGDAQPHDVPR
jgi:hypothetical protein